MLTCSDHAGALVVYLEGDKCPVCAQMAFVREFELKLLDMEADIHEMKIKNKREMSEMTAELTAYASQARI